MSRLIQYFEDDIRGFVKFIDTKADQHGRKAQAAHIKLMVKIPAAEARMLKQAIADDINLNEEEFKK